MSVPRPDFSGFRRMDIRRSQLMTPPPRDRLMRFVRRDPDFTQDGRTMDAAGRMRAGRFAGRADGAEFSSQIAGAPCTSCATWDGNEPTIRSLLSLGEGRIELADTGSLSEDEVGMEHRSGMLAGQLAILKRITDPAETGMFDG